MTQRDRATVDVELLRVEVEYPGQRNYPRRATHLRAGHNATVGLTTCRQIRYTLHLVSGDRLEQRGKRVSEALQGLRGSRAVRYG